MARVGLNAEFISYKVQGDGRWCIGGDFSAQLLTLWLVNPIYDCDWANLKQFWPPIDQSEAHVDVFLCIFESSRQFYAVACPTYELSPGDRAGRGEAQGDLFLILQHDLMMNHVWIGVQNTTFLKTTFIKYFEIQRLWKIWIRYT